LQAGGQILVGSFVNAGPAFFLLARLIPVLYRCTKVFIFKEAGRSFQNSSIAKRYKSSIQKPEYRPRGGLLQQESAITATATYAQPGSAGQTTP
jgi:hypothetical protein